MEEAIRDNWQHRSRGLRCSSCMWFVEKAVRPGSMRLGRCRKHAPTMTGFPVVYSSDWCAMNGFPVVYSSDWCGDHKIDENKLTVNETLLGSG